MTEEYTLAKQVYAKLGVDTEEVLEKLSKIPLSLHCWQADDVGGFEVSENQLGGGLAVTGNYKGKAKTVEELRQDYLKAFSLIPAKRRINLHAIYGEFNGKFIDRNEIEIKHFQGWINWCKIHGIGLDFNSTLFSHPKAESGFTLSSKNPEIRLFWIDHCIKCREISAEIGKQLGTPCVYNIWIPDGSKDTPIDRFGHRKLLRESLEKIFEKPIDPKFMIDAIEPKLFGISSESYVVGSHDFYLSYAVKNNVMLTMDMGHYHPTESVADKISAILPFTNKILLHISRGVRWDSDHVVILNDEVRAVAEEIIRTKRLNDIYIALDYFDASINRIAAWVVGARATVKSLLIAMLQPYDKLLELEENGHYTQRLALLEDIKTMPWAVVWNEYCKRMNVPTDLDWIEEVETYESEVLSKRQ
jgi:L-rhamnose isomerase